MKLYFAPGACSLAPHIALNEQGIAAETIRVDLATHKLADGTDYRTINPKGYVPMLELDDGTRLTEAAVILQYIADRKPGTLAPVFGTLERWKLMEWLNFIATEIHKGYGPLWHHPSPEVREQTVANLHKRYAIAEAQFAKTPFLTGSAFTIADAYLYTITTWSGYLKVDLAAYPNVAAYMKRISERPAVVATLADERKAKHPA
ncbi:MAG: glutathione transferase GstA [Betaproteobacteria bacterium]